MGTDPISMTSELIISFVVVYPRSQPHAYFLFTRRLWKLASDCLASLFLQTNHLDWPKKIATAPLLAALIGILFLPIQKAVLATLACIALPSFLILGLKPRDFAHRLLSWCHFVVIGLISYSPHHWHWPVLVLGRWTLGITRETIPFQIFLIGCLTWMSYQFVKSPLRHSRWPSSRSGTILISLLASGVSPLSQESCRPGFLTPGGLRR